MIGVFRRMQFGAFEAHLAEAIVIDHGANFILSRWGAAPGMLCGGDHRGQMRFG